MPSVSKVSSSFRINTLHYVLRCLRLEAVSAAFVMLSFVCFLLTLFFGVGLRSFDMHRFLAHLAYAAMGLSNHELSVVCRRYCCCRCLICGLLRCTETNELAFTGRIFTARKQSLGKVIFLHLSVILFTGEWGSASVHAGIHPPGGEPPEDTPPPPGKTPGRPPRKSSACWAIRATSRQYASYWNAFLFDHVTRHSCPRLPLGLRSSEALRFLRPCEVLPLNYFTKLWKNDVNHVIWADISPIIVCVEPNATRLFQAGNNILKLFRIDLISTFFFLQISVGIDTSQLSMFHSAVTRHLFALHAQHCDDCSEQFQALGSFGTTSTEDCTEQYQELGSSRELWHRVIREAIHHTRELHSCFTWFAALALLFSGFGTQKLLKGSWHTTEQSPCKRPPPPRWDLDSCDMYTMCL